jgi:carboxymethylenebutenolidase
MSDLPRRLSANDFDPEVLHVFDQYVHGDIDRREFLARVGRLALGTMTAAGILGALSPRFAEAQQV